MQPEAEPALPSADIVSTNKPVVCFRHPFNETDMYCLHCGKPICTSCKKQIALGIYCPDCILLSTRGAFVGQENVGETRDYVLAIILPLLLSLIPGTLILFILFSPNGQCWIPPLLFGFGAICGTLIAKLFRYATNGRRGRYIVHTVAGATAMGSVLPALFIGLISLVLSFSIPTLGSSGISLILHSSLYWGPAYFACYIYLR